MSARSVVVVLVVLVCMTLVASQPLMKVHCAGQPLFRGRVDTIVNPGIVANHVHRVFGASNFGPETATTSPKDVYTNLRNSACSSCSLPTVDNSVYWHPELFYRWPNGSLTLIPHGGLTVYYEGRTGNGNQANPKYTAFPPGFRMTAGNPFRRSFNKSVVADTAITFACLAAQPSKETNGFPDPSQHCINGLRMQVYFPMCWNGKDIDTPDHQSHVAYPSHYDGGNCPDAFPVRLLGVFFEADYSVSEFPQQTYQPFVLSCGDSTGYGMHGDFLNGWDQNILQKAIEDPTCDHTSTNNGNNVKACAPLSSYVVEPSDGACELSKPIPLTESLGMIHPIPRLPGCQNITGEQSVYPTPCMSSPQLSYSPPISERFILKSKSTGMFVSAPAKNTQPLTLVPAVNPTLKEVFGPLPWSSGSIKGISLVPESAYGLTNVCSAHGTNSVIICDRRSASPDATSYEAFQIVPQSGGYIAIKAMKNNQYVTVQADHTLAPTSSTVGDAQLFQQLTPDGGHL